MEIVSGNDVLMVSPILMLLFTGLALMLLDAFKVHKPLGWVAGLGVLASCVMALPPVLEGLGGTLQPFSMHNMMRTDSTAALVHIFLSVSALFTLFFVGDFMKRQPAKVYDIYALLVFSLTGMVMLANANDLIMTFIGLETMSICLYVMAAMYKKDVRSNEAGLKYFLLGAFATGFFIYGIALIYGASGSTNFGNMDFGRLATSPLFYPGIGMLVIGFLFKVSAFPFHAWTPDVYSGTPTPLTGFMATGSKAAAFIAMAMFINLHPSIATDDKLQIVILACALLTMIYGNIVAARQTNLKRMLAYSSIAHSGYVLLAVTSGERGLESVIFYMLIYTLMNIGAFGLVGMAETTTEDNSLSSWKGFGRTNPWLGAALSVFLFSLAGIPPLAGFMGKYFVFAAAISNGIIIPAIVGILTSVVGAYYYISVVKTMYFDEKDTPKVVTSKDMAPTMGIVLLVILVVAFGVFPSLIQDYVTGVIGGQASLPVLPLTGAAQ
ncbi:MAG TPA: NADH-quinone oxidoreductase subunit N [Bacteroidia bacterium]|nr:NADH-quinone oxidoreductase subunit N [Bacteroidia bacterium]